MTMLAKNDSLLKTTLKTTALCLFPMLFYTQNAQAEGKLTVYCSVQNVTCEKVTKRFAEKYHVDTQFVRNSTGTVLGKIKAEKDNPQADVWFGGTFEPHLQAADQGLLAVYRSPLQKDIMPQFKKLMDERGDYTSIIYLMEVAIGVNTEKLKQLNIPEPKCFADLLKPEFKNQIQYADPRVSGTGYSFLTTLVQLWGEEKAFDFLKALHPNVSQYTKSGVTPSRNAARGETAVGIGFLHDYALEKRQGAPLELVVPCEGTGYELGGVSILKGARNIDNAKLFVDWALSKEGQELAWKQGESLQILTNTTAEQSPTAFDPNKLNLINYDFEKYGATEQRKALIEKWVQDVKLAK